VGLQSSLQSLEVYGSFFLRSAESLDTARGSTGEDLPIIGENSGGLGTAYIECQVEIHVPV
jgi:hypothetical protein